MFEQFLFAKADPNFTSSIMCYCTKAVDCFSDLIEHGFSAIRQLVPNFFSKHNSSASRGT
jgi:hypothetical protein